jgi:hypothetical protein
MGPEVVWGRAAVAVRSRARLCTFISRSVVLFLNDPNDAVVIAPVQVRGATHGDASR